VSRPGRETGAPLPPEAGAVADPAAIMARARDENFPVALRWLPAATRRHLLAIYGFARLADELGDSAGGDRLEALHWVEEQLGRAFNGTSDDPLLAPLATTIEQCGLSREPFERLIEANRRDQRTRYYERFDDLLGYCELSANPVGRLVLEVFGVADTERIARSDAICTALQLVEHWQDVGEDVARGRVYIPLADLARFDCSVDDLQAGAVSEPLRRVLSFEAARTAALFDQGSPLVVGLRGWARLAVAGYLGGGRAALGALARADYEVLAARPRPSRRRVIGSILRALDGWGLR
jgi:squalene synthase HpnC